MNSCDKSIGWVVFIQVYFGGVFFYLGVCVYEMGMLGKVLKRRSVVCHQSIVSHQNFQVGQPILQKRVGVLPVKAVVQGVGAEFAQINLGLHKSSVYFKAFDEVVDFLFGSTVLLTTLDTENYFRLLSVVVSCQLQLIF